MAVERPKLAKKNAWYQARPSFLIAGGVALVAFGVLFGAALDLATRPASKAPARTVEAPHPSRQSQAPRLPEAFPSATQPSILDSPNRESARAWANDATPPMTAFAAPSTAAPRRPVIAVVIDDMGLDRPRSLRVIALSGPLTVSLMTYADGLPDLAKQAREAGHEVMAHLPMEPIDSKENPGRGALTVAMTDDAIRKTLAADLDGWNGYVGINNHMGSKFTMDRPRMAVVMNELKARGLLWLDSKTTGESVGPSAARAAGVPYVERDVFLDNVEEVAAVMAQLAVAESTAKAHGSAIAIGHPHDATIAALKQWLPYLESHGISLVPVTEVLRRRSINGTDQPS